MIFFYIICLTDCKANKSRTRRELGFEILPPSLWFRFAITNLDYSNFKILGIGVVTCKLKICLESDFRCTYREANDFFHKIVEEHAKSNNKKARYHKCAQEREIDYILAITSSIVPKSKNVRISKNV
jgi:hypothetical protein